MTAAKKARKSDWKDGFLFVGNHLILDFLNTRPIQNGQLVELLPDFSALLRWFEAAGLLRAEEASKLAQRWGRSTAALHITKAMQKLRESLGEQILKLERGGSPQPAVLGELNKLMAAHPMRARLKQGAGGSKMELWFSPRRPQDLFAPLAHSAAELFSTADRNRLRKCGNCVLHFCDISKKGTRRWCSMQLCGNRLKVAAYARRQRTRISQ